LNYDRATQIVIGAMPLTHIKEIIIKSIPLTKGKSATIDDEDLDRLSKHKWRYNGSYAVRDMHDRGKHWLIYMHREVNQTPDGLVTDHIDRNKLNNTRGNLRSVTHKENMQNKSPYSRTSHPGISWAKKRNKWEVRAGNKQKFLGYYSDIDDAIDVREKYLEGIS
jgi:hypothetical protein